MFKQRSINNLFFLTLILTTLTVLVPGCTDGLFAGKKSVVLQRADWSDRGLIGRKITTEHYTVYSTIPDPDFEQYIPELLEAAYDRYEDTFDTRFDKPLELTTYVFGARREYEWFIKQNYRARFDTYSRIRTGGFTEGTTSVNIHTSRSTTLATLVHEGWHQYVAGRLKRPIPAWLNEGLACYHESVSFAGNKPKFSPKHNTFRINSLREAVQRKEMIPLAKIVDTHAGQVIRQNHSVYTQTYYAQAWALTLFLKHKEFGSEFDRMMHDIANGEFTARVGATRLTQPDRSDASFGLATFVHYFNCRPQDIEDEYYEHVLELCGF